MRRSSRRTVAAVLVAATTMATAASGCASVVLQPDDDAGVGGAAETNGSLQTTGSAKPSATGSTADATAASGTGAGCGSDDVLPSYVAETCPQALTWPIACLSLSSPGVIGLNPETGETCVIADTVGTIPSESFALVGDTIIGCSAFSDTVVRLDVRTGITDEASVPKCMAITDANDVLLVLQLVQSFNVGIAPSFDSLLQGGLGASAISPHAESLGACGNDLYAAWHSTHEIEHWDIANQKLVGTVALQSFDDWIYGVGPVDDGRIIIAKMREVWGFTATGELLFVTPVEVQPYSALRGLRCFTP